MTHFLPGPLLAIRSYGAVTNIGNSASQTLASWISQARRMRRITLDGFADPFTIADCPSVTDGKHGIDRLLALLESAISEAMETAIPPGPPTSVLNLLLLPDWVDNQARAQLVQRTADLWSSASALPMAMSGGSTIAWQALEHAYRALLADAELQHVVIAAVDSVCEPDILRQAANAGRLLQAGNSQGFVAGEGAACIVLERVSSADDLPANHFALHRPAITKQATRWWPDVSQPQLETFASIIPQALKNAGMEAQHISHLLSDMDGSDWRSRLESSALSCTLFLETSELPQWRPATLLGQIGTPTGLLGWILPAAAHIHRIARVNTVLNWSIDPAGEAAACVLERSPH